MKKTPFAKKSFGQNFLVDNNYIEKIISALNPQAGEAIIEIGAGRGALTSRLVASGADIIAIELDKDLIPILQHEFGDGENFTLVENDALKIDFRELLQSQHSQVQSSKSKLVANLPYYISTAILQKLIEQQECFSELVLMLQREVVKRITAEAGNSERGFLSVLVEAFAETEKLFDVPPNAFRPVPKVWSSVIRIKFRELRPIIFGKRNEQVFRQLVSAGFAQKRKTILNNFKNASSNLQKMFDQNGGISSVLDSVKIDQRRRAESLTLEEWQRISDSIISNKVPE